MGGIPPIKKGATIMKKLLIVLLCAVALIISGTAYAENDNSESEAEAESNSAATVNGFNDNSTNEVNSRNFVNPGVTPLPHTNGFFTSPTPDSSFRSIVDIIRVMGEGTEVMFTKGALRNLAKGGDMEKHIQVVRGADQIPRVYGPETDDNEIWLTVTYENPKNQVDCVDVTGYLDAEADDADTNSLQVIGEVGLAVVADGNDYMVLTAEGAHRKVEASGWGIGFYTTGGLVSDSGKSSGIMGGGTGWSTNETGPEDRPWIQGYFGVKKAE